VVEVLSKADLKIDGKADFTERANLEALVERMKAAGVPAQVLTDEEHSAFYAMFHDSTNAERRIGVELAQQPEYRKYRLLSKDISAFNKPPFTVLKNENRDTIANWRDLLDHVKVEGKRDASVQRYKGLGEMNAEQLADTTMNPEKRTLLVVRLEDVVATDLIFTTLMGEDVESRRKFIEENALEVKNLDV
jgi:DNA gyrase subunit B